MTPTLRLLLLEDRARDAELLIEHLLDEGLVFEWTRVQTRQDFLAEIANQPDLILADYNLPQFSGLEAVKLLKQQNLDIPLIVVSGTVGEDRAVECIKEGAADYLLKDRLGRLSAAVQRAMADKEARRREEAIKASLAFMAAVVESADNAIIGESLDGIVLSWNSGAQKLYGYTEEEMIGQHISKIAPPEDHAEIEKNLQTIRRGEAIHFLEAVRITKDGHKVDVSLTVSPIFDAEGKPKAASIIARNITKRKQAERSLQESEARFRRLTENAPDVIFRWRIDPPGLEYLSPAVEAVSGYAPEEFMAKPGLLMEIAHPEDRQIVRGMVTGQLPFKPQEARIIHKNGQTVWIERRSSPVYDEDGVLIATEGIVRDITENRRTNEVLHYHADLIDQLYDAVISTDLQYNVRSWNRAAERIYGWTVEEAIEKPMSELLKTEYITATAQEVLTAFMKDGMWSGEVVQEHKNGSKLTIQSSVMMIRDSAGHSTGLVAVNRDITERKQVEAAEREQRKLADALRDVAATLTGTLDLEEVLARILDTVGQVLPHDAKTIMLVENGIARVVSHAGYEERGMGKDASQISFVIKETLNLAYMAETGRSLCIPNTKDYIGWYDTDTTKWIRSSIGAPIRLSGEVLGFINLDSGTPGFFTDEQAVRLQAFADQVAIAIKNARLYQELEAYSSILEEAVRERTAELQAATHRAETILNSVSDALLVLSRDSRIQQVNPAFVQQTGYQIMDAFLQVHHELLKLEFGSRDDYQNILKNLIPGQQWHGQTKVLRKDGSSYDAELTVAPVRDESGEINLLVAVLRDITPLKEVARAKDEFVSNVSHELRTPITGIKLNYSMLSLNPERREVYMERIGREINRLNELIEDLLRLTRLEQGRIELALQSTDLNEVGLQLVNDRVPIAETRRLALAFEGVSDLEKVTADPGLLGQAISVLLTNAMNYTPAEGQIKIKTRRHPQRDNCVGISVEDTGPGIPREEQPKLFERFYRGAVGRASGAAGTGLGLNIASQIIERHQGELELFSEGIPGKGSVFTIWLPVEYE